MKKQIIFACLFASLALVSCGVDGDGGSLSAPATSSSSSAAADYGNIDRATAITKYVSLAETLSPTGKDGTKNYERSFSSSVYSTVVSGQKVTTTALNAGKNYAYTLGINLDGSSLVPTLPKIAYILDDGVTLIVANARTKTYTSTAYATSNESVAAFNATDVFKVVAVSRLYSFIKNVGTILSDTTKSFSTYRYNSTGDGNLEIKLTSDNIAFVENLSASTYSGYYEVKFDQGSLSSVTSYVSISDTYKLKVTCGYTFGDFDVSYPNLSKYTEEK